MPSHIGRKSRGIISIGGTLYMWVNPRSVAKGFISQRLYFSTDRAQSWDRIDWDFPESDKIVNLTFAQFGKDYAGAPNNYVYIYAERVKDDSGPVIQKPGEIVLMRVAKTKLKNRNAYRFFAGMRSYGISRTNGPAGGTSI